jgi:hypothetical protein
MRPLFVLLLIVTGSAVAIAVSLAMAAVVFLLLPEYSVRLAPERGPLITGLVWSWLLSGVGTAALVGEWRARPWRRYAYAALAAMLLILGWLHRPF